MTFFDIALQTRASLHPEWEPHDLISEHVGYIRCEGDDGQERRVGKVRAWRIQANLAAESGESLFDVCDAHSHLMHVLHTLLYEPDQYHFQHEVIARFDAMESDCLVLDYVVLHPGWRGLKLGLLAARKMIDLLGGGCGLVVSEIAPLRRDAHAPLKVPASWIPRQATRGARREAVLRLRRYFRRLGFTRLDRTPYYVLSLARRVPTLAELLRPQEPE
jgi:hypothetical protein